MLIAQQMPSIFWKKDINLKNAAHNEIRVENTTCMCECLNVGWKKGSLYYTCLVTLPIFRYTMRVSKALLLMQ